MSRSGGDDDGHGREENESESENGNENENETSDVVSDGERMIRIHYDEDDRGDRHSAGPGPSPVHGLHDDYCYDDAAAYHRHGRT